MGGTKGVVSKTLAILIVTVVCGILTFWIVNSGIFPKYYSPRENFESKLFLGRNGAVVSDHEVCSRIGIDVLRNLSGNAVDAAIATALCLGVVNPFSSGLGGGGVFTLYLNGSKTLQVIDFRELSPRNENSFIGIPGEILGFSKAHSKYGKIKWEELFQPAIKLAEEGFPVSYLLREKINSYKDKIQRDPDGLGQLLLPNNEIPQVGDIIKRQNYANTLRKLSSVSGPDSFYKGEIAQQIISDLKGAITTEDLKHFYDNGVVDMDKNEIVKESVNGYQIYTTGPPFGGPLVKMVLNILEGYTNLKFLFEFESTSTMKPRQQADNIHIFAEALKYAFSNNINIINTNGSYKNVDWMNWMMSKPAAAQIRQLIWNSRTFSQSNHYLFSNLGSQSLIYQGTTFLTVADSSHNIASITSSIHDVWGVGILSPELGIVYNDQLDGRARIGASWRKVESCMAPVLIMKDENPFLMLGGSGGSRIISGVSQVLMSILQNDGKIEKFEGMENIWRNNSGIEKEDLDRIKRGSVHKMSLLDIITGPRVHTDFEHPGILQVEPGISDAVLSDLNERGHNIITFETIGGTVQILMITKDGYQAISDPRKYGLAATY